MQTSGTQAGTAVERGLRARGSGSVRQYDRCQGEPNGKAGYMQTQRDVKVLTIH